MALISCVECNKEVSDQASSCPHCGCPVVVDSKPATQTSVQRDIDKSKTTASNSDDGSSGGSRLVFVLVAVLLASLVMLAIANGGVASRERKAYLHAKDVIYRQLKSPATAEFASQMKSTISKRDNTYKVKSYVDSQNGFGAVVRTQFTVEVSFDDNGNPRTVSIDMD